MATALKWYIFYPMFVKPKWAWEVVIFEKNCKQSGEKCKQTFEIEKIKRLSNDFFQRIHLVSNRAWSSWDFLVFEFWSSGLSFSGFKIPNFFEFEFFVFKKIGSKLVEFSSYRVWEKFLTKIWPKCSNIFWQYFLKFRIRIDRVSIFGFFFEFRFWQSLDLGLENS